MARNSFILFAFAHIGLNSADPIPVFRDRLIRRCDNHSTYYSTGLGPGATSGAAEPTPWPIPWVSIWPVPPIPTASSFSLPCGGYGLPCSNATGATTDFANSRFSPSSSPIVSTTSPDNETISQISYTTGFLGNSFGALSASTTTTNNISLTPSDVSGFTRSGYVLPSPYWGTGPPPWLTGSTGSSAGSPIPAASSGLAPLVLTLNASLTSSSTGTVASTGSTPAAISASGGSDNDPAISGFWPNKTDTTFTQTDGSGQRNSTITTVTPTGNDSAATYTAPVNEIWGTWSGPVNVSLTSAEPATETASSLVSPWNLFSGAPGKPTGPGIVASIYGSDAISGSATIVNASSGSWWPPLSETARPPGTGTAPDQTSSSSSYSWPVVPLTLTSIILTTTTVTPSSSSNSTATRASSSSLTSSIVVSAASASLSNLTSTPTTASCSESARSTAISPNGINVNASSLVWVAISYRTLFTTVPGGSNLASPVAGTFITPVTSSSLITLTPPAATPSASSASDDKVSQPISSSSSICVFGSAPPHGQMSGEKFSCSQMVTVREWSTESGGGGVVATTPRTSVRRGMVLGGRQGVA